MAKYVSRTTPWEALSEEERARREGILHLLDRIEDALDEDALSGEVRLIVQAGLQGIEDSLKRYDEKHEVEDDSDEVL